MTNTSNHEAAMALARSVMTARLSPVAAKPRHSVQVDSNTFVVIFSQPLILLHL